MTTSLTDGTNTITPSIVDGFDSVRRAQSIVHPIIGRSDPDVTIRPAATRTGTLTLVFADEADAADAEWLLGMGAVWTLADTDRATLGMVFVVAEGGIGFSLDKQTRDAWIVTVPFVEVAP